MLKENFSNNWYEDAFNENYIFLFDPLRTPEFTENEVDCMLKLLNLPSGAKVLDLGCGYGRHSIMFRKKGFNVVGMDYSNVLLTKAKADSQGMGIEWIQSDMRNIPFENEFDLVINNAFGYLENDNEEQIVLNQIYKCLKTNGKLLQWEIPNKLNWSKKYVTYESANMNEFLVERKSEYDFLSGKEYQSYILSKDSNVLTEQKFAVRVFDLPELLKMYKDAGLIFESVTSLQGEPVSFDVAELCLICSKS